MGCGASAPPRIVVSKAEDHAVLEVESREPMDETHTDIEETLKEEAYEEDLGGLTAGLLPMTATPGRWRKRSTCKFTKVYQPEGWNLSVRMPIRRG